MENISKKEEETAYVLVSLPKSWVDQIDTFARYYRKSRLAFLRDFIRTGIDCQAEKFANRHKEAEAMNRIFAEMSASTEARRKADF